MPTAPDSSPKPGFKVESRGPCYVTRRCVPPGPLYRAIMTKPDPPPRPSPTVSASLCRSCSYVRTVKGRLGQTYFLCENDEVAEKYPEQPRLECAAYAPVEH